MESAKGLKGFLLSFDGECTFRVYHDEKDEDGITKFTDYEIIHPDLQITIDDDDAFIYKREDGEPYIYVSPKTLGRSET